MYNFQGGSPYGPPRSFGGFAGQNVPGMGAPPGMAAPGTAPPPGLQSNEQQPSRPGGFPSNFQPPANMPNINFNAPVIRLGTTGPPKPAMPIAAETGRREPEQRPARAGVGMDMNAQRQAVRESMMQLIPPTKEEIVRTIFVGCITEGSGGDEGIERILQCAGNLRRWIRAMDADNKACRFGFAEYEDPESLAIAVEVLKDVEVPVKSQAANGVKTEDDEEMEIEKSKLLVMVDGSSYNYLEQCEASHGDTDPIQAQLRLDAAKSALEGVLADLSNPSAPTQTNEMSKIDQDGDYSMQNGEEKPGAEVVTIPLSADDELSDIPAEMREIVAKEIQAFRDRSTRRDMERLRKEEELEAMERRRNMGQSRASRLASPPLTAPSGPAGGANGIPLGPRDRGVPNAPAGPKGYTDLQITKDYQKGVTFVNGNGVNGASTTGLIDREDEDSDASDEEIERRKREKKEAEQEKLYYDQKRRWLNRERSRTAAVEREKARDKEEQAHKEAEREAVARRLREWNDDVEASRKVEEYYVDRSLWIRNRATFRTREASMDDMDRAAEQRERAKDDQQKEQARGMADDFLNRQAVEMAAPREPQRFKLSFGAAAQKAQQANTGKRTVAEVEGLLEDEEEADNSTKRTLIPIKFDSAADAMGLTEEERAQAARQLAADIPSDKDGLWKWPVKWEFVDESVLSQQIRPFVEKKIVEYLGVQEQMLVEVVEDHIRKRGEPQALVGELEGALDEEAEVLVKKLWRMVIFFSESEKRGLSA
ncbi:MAG: hypothetical protein Q9217_005494 [Psora testacea]